MNTIIKLTNLSKEELCVCFWRPGEDPTETAEVWIIDGGGIVILPHDADISVAKERAGDLRIDKFVECSTHSECDCDKPSTI